MSTPRPDSPRPPTTLEDLLRLKRAERPASEFWSEFEHGLRQKQLAASIEPRPWWLGLRLALRRFSPTPVITCTGLAAAAAAITFIALQPSSSSTSNSALELAALTAPPASLAPDYSAARTEEPGLGVVALPPSTAPLANETSAPPESPTVAAALSPTVTSPTLTSPASFAVLGASPASPRASYALAEPSIELIEQPALLPLGSDNTSVFNTAAAAFALSSAPSKTARDSRHARLLALAESTAAEPAASLDQVREHTVHHLAADDSLYASATRLGVGADRLSLRF